MAKLTIEEIARFFSNNKETETIKFINENANKLYCASYKSGSYGKIFLNFIKNNYPTPLNFNGMLTSLALEITTQLEQKGFGFKNENQNISFIKIEQKN